MASTQFESAKNLDLIFSKTTPLISKKLHNAQLQLCSFVFPKTEIKLVQPFSLYCINKICTYICINFWTRGGFGAWES